MDQRDYYGTRPRRGVWAFLFLPIIAFVLGLVGAALALHHWASLDKLVHPVSENQPVNAPAPATSRPAATTQPALPPDDPALDQRVAAIESRIDDIDTRAA